MDIFLEWWKIVETRAREWLYTIENELNAIESYTLKWLFVCYVHFTFIKHTHIYTQSHSHTYKCELDSQFFNLKF